MSHCLAVARPPWWAFLRRPPPAGVSAIGGTKERGTTVFSAAPGRGMSVARRRGGRTPTFVVWRQGGGAGTFARRGIRCSRRYLSHHRSLPRGAVAVRRVRTDRAAGRASEWRPARAVGGHPAPDRNGTDRARRDRRHPPRRGGTAGRFERHARRALLGGARG